MSRLTKREKAQLSNGEEVVICNHDKADCNDSCMYGRCKWNKKAIEKLKAYEDKEEQGLLLELPVPIGTTVYIIEDDYEDIYEPSSRYYYVDEIEFDCGLLHLWGKYVFATEAEAEETLAKMGGK